VYQPDANGPATIDVRACHDADDDGVVSLALDLDGHERYTNLSPAAARTLARQLGEAATFADEGAGTADQ
jgi:hypothetical protein